MPAVPTIDRAALVADLERARADFHELLSRVGDDEWGAPTSGTRWTNEELLFHMVYGYMVVQRLLILVRLLDRLPVAVSRNFARILNATTRPFDVINYYGTRSAAIVYNRDRMGKKMEGVVDALERSLARADDRTLLRGMHFPTRWDPYFHDYMMLADVYSFPGEHYDHHRRQLKLDKLA